MPGVRNMDRGARDAGHQKTQGVREPAQIHYPRKCRENWPFRLYEENGRVYQNTAPRKRKTVNLDDVEDAPW